MIVAGHHFLVTALLLASYVDAIRLQVQETWAIDEMDTDFGHTTRVILSEVSDLLEMKSLIFDDGINGKSEITYSKTIASRATRLDGSVEYVWRGRLVASSDSTDINDEKDALIGVATIVEHGDGIYAATFGTATSVYSLSKMTSASENGASFFFQVQETSWSFVQEEQEPAQVDDEFMVDSATARSVPLQVSVQEFVPALDPVQTLFSVGDVQAITTDETNVRGRRNLLQTSIQTEEPYLQETIVVDVLIFITDRARCESAGLPLEKCPFSKESQDSITGKVLVAVHETNHGLFETGVHVSLHIAGIVFLDPGDFDELTPVSQTLRLLSQEPTLQYLRDEVNADLISLITGKSTSNTGISYLNGAESVTSWSALPNYTFQHEILHNFGCDHDLLNKVQYNAHPYGHGLQLPQRRMRTVMSYDCAIRKCARIPYPSANGYFYRGVAIGDPTHDNARLIRENATRVANLRIAGNEVTNQTISAPAMSPSDVYLEDDSKTFLESFLAVFAFCFAF